LEIVICLGWSWSSILLISASQVAWITGVSHQYPSSAIFLKPKFGTNPLMNVTDNERNLYLKSGPGRLSGSCDCREPRAVFLGRPQGLAHGRVLRWSPARVKVVGA
jgi:hypothetical protein